MNCRFVDLQDDTPPSGGRVGAGSWRRLLDRASILPYSRTPRSAIREGASSRATDGPVVLIHGAGPAQAERARAEIEASGAARWVLLDPVPSPGETAADAPEWIPLVRGAHRILTTSQGGARLLAGDLVEEQRLVRLSPFLDSAPVVDAKHRRGDTRRRIARAAFFPDHEVWIVVPAPLGDTKSPAVLERTLGRMVGLRWRLLVVGPAAGSAAFRGMLARLPRDRFHAFSTGEPGSAEELDLLVCGDLYLWPAIEDSGLTSMLQAVTSGIPVVACDTLETRARVQDGTTGRLLQPGNAEALANATTFLLGHEDLRATFARQAEQSALTYHELGAVARGAARVLAEITA